MTFYFAWVKDKEAFNPQIHNREEEEVVHLEILHQEGEFPTALLRIKNLKETGKCRLFVSYEDEKGTHLLFAGWRRDLPLEGEEGLVTLELTGESPWAREELQSAQQCLKRAPHWDPLLVAPREQDELDEILDSQPLLPHWSRQGDSVIFSHITEGRQVLDLGQNFFKDSLKMRLLPLPFSTVCVDASVEWVQRYDGVTDLTPAFAPHGLLSTLTGEELVKRWWRPDTPLKNSGYTILKSTLRSMEPPESGVLGLYPRTSLPFETKRGQATLPRYWFKPTLTVQWNYRQKRREVFRFTVRGRETGPVKHLRLNLQNVADQMDSSLPSFFLTERGRQVTKNLVTRAHTYLVASTRVFQVTVQTPFEEVLALSCDHEVALEDPQLPGGHMRGKVVGYRLVVDGTTGHKFGEVKLAGYLDKARMDIPVLKDYGHQGPKEGILDPKNLGALELVTGMEMIRGVDEQNALLAGRRFEGISQAFRLVRDHFTRLRLELRDLRATEVLTHVIEGEIL